MGQRETTRQIMEALISSYHSSKLNRKEFSAQEGLHISKLDYWINKFSEEQRSGSFIALNVSRSKVTSSDLEIHYPNGIIIKPAKSPVSFINELIKSY